MNYKPWDTYIACQLSGKLALLKRNTFKGIVMMFLILHFIIKFFFVFNLP